MNLCC